jgi:hypothetical protein
MVLMARMLGGTTACANPVRQVSEKKNTDKFFIRK